MIMENKNNTYSIGAVASLLNLSTDTIRHYEKRGLITPAKLENGYRSYTDEDLFNLLFILYFRKMDIGLNHIMDFLKEQRTSEKIENVLESRIREEEENILRHQQNITRIRLSIHQNKKLQKYQQGFSIQPFPKAYIISEQTSAREMLFQWFRYAQQTPGLDMAYIYNEYSFPDSGSRPVPQNSRLLLYEETAPAIPEAFQVTAYPLTSEMLCVCHICTCSSSHCPPQELLVQMKEWAKRQGYRTADSFHTTVLYGQQEDRNQKRDLEIYLPIRNSDPEQSHC